MVIPGKTALAAAIVGVVGLLVPGMAGATVTAPNTTIDEYGGTGACSLREAVQAANTDVDFGGCLHTAGPDVITLQSGQTYELTSSGDDATNVNGDLDILGNVTIEASGDAPATIDATGPMFSTSDRVLDIAPTVSVATVILDKLVITGGFTGAVVPSNYGGGIRQNALSGDVSVIDSRITGNEGTDQGGGIWAGGGSMTVRGSTIDHNKTTTTSFGNGQGGGVFSQAAALQIEDSTVSSNQAANDGGGVFVPSLPTAHATLNNVTVAGNEADVGSDTVTSGDGGGIAVYNAVIGSLQLRDTLIGDNVDHSSPSSPDCALPLTGLASFGFNLVENATGCFGLHGPGDPAPDLTGADPKLAPLADNGGPTPTQGLIAGSPAIDAGNPAPAGPGGCDFTDQRGVSRGATRCDIGAFEGVIPATCPDPAAANCPGPPMPGATETPAAKCKKKKKKGKKKAAYGAASSASRPGAAIAKKKKKKCGKKKKKKH